MYFFKTNRITDVILQTVVNQFSSCFVQYSPYWATSGTNNWSSVQLHGRYHTGPIQVKPLETFGLEQRFQMKLQSVQQLWTDTNAYHFMRSFMYLRNERMISHVTSGVWTSSSVTYTGCARNT